MAVFIGDRRQQQPQTRSIFGEISQEHSELEMTTPAPLQQQIAF